MGRFVISVALGLISAPLILNALGFVDYGLVTALAATGPLMALLTHGLGRSAERHMAVAIGRGDSDALRSVFQTALLIYASFGGVLLSGGLAIEPLVFAALTIPEDRFAASQWVYRLMIFGLSLQTITVSYRSMLVAQQNVMFKSVLDVTVQAITVVFIAMLFLVQSDRMVFYAGAMFAVQVAGTAATIGYVCKRYPEGRPGFRRASLGQLRELATFAGWTIVGIAAKLGRLQVSIMILNVLAGPVVNAALALATRLAVVLERGNSALIFAIQPAITSVDASGNRLATRKLALAGSKIPNLVITVIALPVMTDAETLLSLWLGEYPALTPAFARMLIIAAWLNTFSLGHQHAFFAKGRIAINSSTDFALLAVMLTVASLGIVSGGGYWLVPGAIMLHSAVMSLLVRPVLLAGVADIETSVWIRSVALPLLAVGGIQGGSGLLLATELQATPWRLLLAVVVSTVVTGVAGWSVALSGEERHLIKRFLNQAKSRLSRARASSVIDARSNPSNPDYDPASPSQD